MNRYDIDKDLFSNIEISNDIKLELYRNCKKGKRTADLRFKYAGVLTALIVILIVGSTGIGAKACYDGIKSRMESMSDKEQESLKEDLQNDTGVTIDGSWSRKLTNDEELRMAELERQYYDLGVYPETEVKRLKTLDEWDGKTLCYIEEDHLLHLPKKEMDDEQLLLFIDYTAKKDYVMEKEAQEYFEEENIKVEDPYVDVDHASEQDIIDLGYKHLVKFLGYELSDEWHARVEAFKPSEVDPGCGTYHDMYTIYWEKSSGSPNSTDYVVVLGMHDLEFRVAAIGGREHWAGLGSYTDEEALKKAKEDKAKVLEKLKSLYGYSGQPDREKMEAYHEYDDYGDTRQIRYVFYYGKEEVGVTWDLADEKMASVEIWNE